jgi:hypothetical protein
MNSTAIFNELIENSIEELPDLDCLCLISRDKLDDTRVVLPQCKHKFNYIPLYKEIVNQKNTFKHMFRLKLGQIMCPYCRIVYNGLLPFIPLKDVVSLHGVNYPKTLLLKIKGCKYVKKNKELCDKNCIGDFCTFHIEKNKKEEIENNIDKCVCVYIFKKGKHKGGKCNKNVKNKDETMCKMHLKNNKIKD